MIVNAMSQILNFSHCGRIVPIGEAWKIAKGVSENQPGCGQRSCKVPGTLFLGHLEVSASTFEVEQGQSDQSGLHMDTGCRTVVSILFDVVIAISLPTYQW